LLELSTEILTHLTGGDTLVVPSRQRAVAVTTAYSASMLHAGKQVWSTPDVLPWSAWVKRCLDEARAQGRPVPRRLSAMEDWLLWQEAVHEACASYQVLMPDAMIEPVRRAVALLEDYGLALPDALTPEAAVLQSSVQHFRRRSRELQVLGNTSWRDVVEYLQPGARVLLAGFSTIGPARRRWLEERGARFAVQADVPGSTRVMRCENFAQEAEAAAQWCVSLFERDANARVLIVVPELTAQRHLWERALSQHLDGALILAGRDSSAQSAFAIEGGRRLTSYRLVATALNLIALTTGFARFDELSAILRSPYLEIPDRAAGALLDRWLREHNVDSAQPQALRSLLELLGRDLPHSTLAQITSFIDALEQTRASSDYPAAWAQTWAALLERCGWPGSATLSSDEQQARMRFDELLGDFAAVAIPVGRLNRTDAWQRLGKMAQRVAFEAASDDVPVTVTSRLEEPIVHYDALWVAGLTADVWPPAARPDPLLPLSLQYAAGIAAASAAGQLKLAQQLQQQWQRCASECVLSWSYSAEDLPRNPSPLLPGEAPDRATCIPTAAAGACSLERWVVSQAPPLESWRDAGSPAQVPAGVLPGGTKLLELQSSCAFNAYAQLRLLATPLPRPTPGIDARVRGNILHEALDLFWQPMRDQSALRERSESARRELIDHSVDAAFEKVLKNEGSEPGQELLKRERARARKLLEHLITWELQRPDFRIERLESTQLQPFTGGALKLRMDRIDRLQDDERLLIIDYKTGKAKKFDAFAERLPQPQLPAYAIAIGALSAAVATVYLGREGIACRGIGDRSDRLGRLPAPRKGEPGWDELMQRWQRQLQGLIDQFLRGEAIVWPLPQACDYCHLSLLCRIDPNAVESDEDDDLDNDLDDEIDLNDYGLGYGG
jgi:ATP-dependent helicase/nuclease subunit B